MAAPPPCSALALDVGRRRIGLAGCDPLGLTVTPLPAVSRAGLLHDLEVFTSLVRQRSVKALIVGLPLDARQRPTAQSRRCRRYALQLARALAGRGLDLPLAWVNEHASTGEAAERFGLHGDRSGRLDSAAAALLLEQWLREGPRPEPVMGATHPCGEPATVAPS